jgi:hypothetical protein
MTVETATYISDLDTNLPENADLIQEGAAVLRLLKEVQQNTFPTASQPLTASFTDLNKVGITPAQTSNDTTPASTAFTQQLVLNASLSASLPSQTGNQRKYLRTDGTSVAFAYAGYEREVRSSNTVLGKADAGKLLDFTSTFTQTLDAAATLGNGWTIAFRNSTGYITIDPNGAETVDGAATLVILPGESGLLCCNGTSFFTVGLAPKGAAIQLSTATASSSATLDFASIFTSNFDVYRVRGTKLKPATDGVSAWLRTSTNGGSSYDSGASDYTYAVGGMTTVPSALAIGVTAAAQILLNSSTIGNATAEWLSFEALVYKPTDAAVCVLDFQGHYFTTAGLIESVVGSGARVAAADVDSFRFMFSSGAIASGTITVEGFKK